MENNNKDLKYLIALSLVPKVGSITARQLISYIGSAEAIFSENAAALQKVPGVGKLIASNIKKADFLGRAEDELEFVDKYGIQASSFLDKSYPTNLKQCEDAPLVIFQKFKKRSKASINISIVGMRKASEYGKHYCNKIITDLKEHGINPVIVSGLAYGIDSCAHKAALDNNLETWAVLGHGLDQIYPKQNTNLAKAILENGRLITEFTHNSFPAPSNFISRNRIIAGLSDLTIVVESARKGGSLVTADLAFGYNREVMAVPGRIGDSKSEGCNFLIKTNKASMLERFEDIVYTMQWNDKKKNTINQQLNLFEELSPEQKVLFTWLKENQNPTFDKICKLSGLDKTKIPSLLLELEFQNLIKPLPGSIYRVL